MKRETIENIIIVIGCLILFFGAVYLIDLRKKTTNEIEVLSKEIDSLNSVEYLKREK